MIYFDNAATTFPKPECVYTAANNCMRNYAVNAGRGTYRSARKAAELITDTRMLLAELASCADPNAVIIAPSATIAMNMVLNGLNYTSNTVVYVSPFEHNAVMRPLHQLSKQYGFSIELLPFDRNTQELDAEKMHNQLYLEMTGTSSKAAKEIPLTIKRSDDSFQVVMLTTGYLKKAKFKVKGVPVSNEFEDRDLKCDVILEIDGDYKFKLSLPMIVYFGELANGMISTICNPSLTHGISKLKANLIRIAAEDTDDGEISIIVNRTDEAKSMKIQIEDKLYFE